MNRFTIAACTIAIATSLVATSSMAVTPSAVPAVDGDPGAIYVPVDDLSQNADAQAKLLRDKMPFISKAPKLVGDDLVWEVDISPMRLTARKGVSLLDRVGGNLFVGAAGVDLSSPVRDGNAKKPVFETTLPSRLVRKAGPMKFRVALPRKVANELRKVPQSKLASRVGIVIWDEKDLDAATPGYDRKQMTHSNVPSQFATYLAGKRAAVEPSGWRGSAPKTRLLRSQFLTEKSKSYPYPEPTSFVIYNGSPFDVAVSFSNVQCNAFAPPDYGAYGPLVLPGSLDSNTSAEWWNGGQIEGSQSYEGDLSEVEESAHSPMEAISKTAEESMKNGKLVNAITGNFSKGAHLFASEFAVGLVKIGVEAAITNIQNKNDGCTNAGTALSLAWTNVSLGAAQTAGNINYWVPSFNRTGNMIGVPPTSIPVVAPGSPLTGYNATSQNGLATSPEILEKELGFGGTVTLATLNSNQQNGSYNGFWCNYANQQIGNPNSSTPTSQYGASSLGGGTTASWGPCVATTYSQGQTTSGSYPGSYILEAEGFSFMIGYSTTAYNTAGPAPAVSQPTTAANAAECISTATPCAFYTPPVASSPPTFGCTPGTWNMLTPWSSTTPTMNLSSPPSAYNASSELSMQLAFTGVTSSGTTGTYFAPPDLGGNVTSSFSPTAVNVWQMTPANLAAVQRVLGTGGYVKEWLCVMTAATTIPSGIPTTSTAMNLGWYGVPTIVPFTNPPGNLLSPPA